MNLVKYAQDSLELYVEEATGLAYAHQAAICRMMPQAPRTTLQRRLEGCPKREIKTAEILTAGGLQATIAYPASVVFDLALEFKAELAAQLVDAGFVSAEKWRDAGIQIVDKRLKRRKPQSVYILQCSQTGVIKIGISNNPSHRLSVIQTGYPFLLTLVRIIKTPRSKGMERKLHKALDDFRLKGEWFDGLCLQMIGS